MLPAYFSWWPVSLFTIRRKNQLVREKRIAYYLWRFPSPTETFVRREVQALKKLGLYLEVFADVPGDLELLDDNEKLLINEVNYLRPINQKYLSKYQKFFFVKNPILYLNLFLYVVFHKFRHYKTFKADISFFLETVYLAGTLKDKNINHIHSPWANRSAFSALIASKLLGVSYTVQARASADLYRKIHAYALAEKFKNAEFVITNSRHNETYLKSLLKRKDQTKIHVIYNGIPLEQFNPKRKGKNLSRKIRLLTVATIGETKGLVDLLKACRILMDMGYGLKCEIIGGTHEPLYTDHYQELKKLHNTLRLEASVFFCGAQPFCKVLEKYNTADIFVLPCIIAKDGSNDITPNVLIEAMAMKLPVVSTHITGIPEIVENFVNGILVPPNDPKSIAEAIVILIKNNDLRKELGKKAREKIEERFDINKNVLRYIDLFMRNQIDRQYQDQLSA